MTGDKYDIYEWNQLKVYNKSYKKTNIYIITLNIYNHEQIY